MRAPKPPTLDHAQHRQRVLDALGPDEAVLVFGAPTRTRNSDSDHRYRPDSDLYWLTGWEDPECAIFLRPGEHPFTLFVQPRDPKREQWDGFRPGPNGAVAEYGADEAFEIGELPEQLTRLVQGVRVLHYRFAQDPDQDALVAGAIQKATRAARRNGLSIPETFHSPAVLLHELRLRKSEAELKVLRRAAALSVEAHRRAMSRTRSGLHEYDIEATLQHTFLAHGSTGAGYTPIVGAGRNATVLHYNRNRDPLCDGDLLLVDAGGEHHYYTADITRTWPVSGRFTDAQTRVYQWVLAAQDRAIDQCRAGRPREAIHEAAVRTLTEGMIDLGLLEGPVDARIEDESYKRYYMHGTSHWLGLDVHDVGAYGRDGAVRTLEPGMVMTVEPGLYIASDDDDAPEALRGIGIRIEDDIVVTDGDPENLTAGAPRTVAEIEALVGQD